MNCVSKAGTSGAAEFSAAVVQRRRADRSAHEAKWRAICLVVSAIMNVSLTVDHRQSNFDVAKATWTQYRSTSHSEMQCCAGDDVQGVVAARRVHYHDSSVGNLGIGP